MADEGAGTAAPGVRVDAVDFWRGMVLCTIYINHIPGNLFEIVTQKNYGYSDSAEAFVFLSGVSLALAYGAKIKRGRSADVLASLAGRAVKLYGIHLVLSVAAVALFAVGAFATEDGGLMQEHGRDLFLDDPKAALLGLLSLGHQIGYFNILPLYLLMLVFAWPWLWLGLRSKVSMLAASSAVYGVTRLYGFSIPTWPMKGSWFFDPWAWQLAMAIGVGVGLNLRTQAVPRHTMLVVAAALVVGLGAFSVTDGFSAVPGLRDWVASWADLDKTTLGLGRVLHFASVAYLLYALRATHWLRRFGAYEIVSRMGRHSLWVFSMLSLLAAVGQILSWTFGHSLLLDGATVWGGLSLLALLAAHLETRRPVLVARPNRLG